MIYDPTVRLMSVVFPEATGNLLMAIKETETQAVSGDRLLHESEAHVLTQLVEPLLDAMGFRKDRQRMEFTPFPHLMLTAHGHDMVMLIVSKMGLTQERDAWARSARQHRRFYGRIIVTDGVAWSVYHPDDEIPDLHFGLNQPGAFWDLLVIGQAHDQARDRGSR